MVEVGTPWGADLRERFPREGTSLGWRSWLHLLSTGTEGGKISLAERLGGVAFGVGFHLGRDDRTPLNNNLPHHSKTLSPLSDSVFFLFPI